MSQNKKETNLANELAKERNRAAADRTLMAWVRTSISLFAFGFVIAKSYEYVEKGYEEKTGKMLEVIPTPVIFGVSFILLGMFGLLAGTIQYKRQLDRFKSDDFSYEEPVPLPQLLSILLLVIGVFGLAVILF